LEKDLIPMSTLRPRNRENASAFTLVELTIAIGIFAMFMATAIAAYLQLTVALKRENIDRKLYGEIESVITDIQRQAKFYDLDYAGYAAGISFPSSELLLVSHDGKSKIRYAKPAGKESIGLEKQRLDSVTGAFINEAGFVLGELQDLTSNEMKVKDLNFYIHPLDQAKVSSSTEPLIYQPKVTIIIHGEINNPFRPEPREFTVQTSISLRHYQ
jgi:type II secretory pathway pseudopilin PulG